jgi:hypothetical protein
MSSLQVREGVGHAPWLSLVELVASNCQSHGGKGEQELFTLVGSP